MKLRFLENKVTKIRETPPLDVQQRVQAGSQYGRCLLCGHICKGSTFLTKGCICGDCLCCKRGKPDVTLSG